MIEYATKADVKKVVDDSIDRLFIKFTGYFDKRIDKVDADISKIDAKYEHLIDTLDIFLKRLDNIEANDAARDVQLVRLERWIKQVATKTGVKLESY